MRALAGFSPAARAVVVAAAIAILVLFIQAGASVFAPILLAVFIAVVATPPLRWLRGRGVPKYLALGIVLFVLLDVGSLFALLTTGALESFRESLPTYQERLLALSDRAGLWLENLGMDHSREAVPDLLNPSAATGLVRSALSSASGTFATGLLVLLAVVFMLAEAPDLAAKLQAAFALSPAGEARLGRIVTAINQYMRIKTLTSLATGTCIWLWLWLLGIDFAALWGILAFVLNFIPFVGAVLMAIPAVLMALVQTDLPTTLLVVLGYMAANTLIGSVLEPKIMGRGLGISTLAVFLSLLFWGWVLGTIGVFLSVPLTMALIIALDASPTTRPVAILLGPAIGERTEAQVRGADA